MQTRLLIDLNPATGRHGQRGIGRYVRGLATGIASFPEDLARRVWAVGGAGPTLRLLGLQGLIAVAPPDANPLLAWATGHRALRAALQRSGAAVVHATDPQRPWGTSRLTSIVTVYDLIPLHEEGMLRSWRLDYRLIYRRYIRQIETATRVLAISHTTAQDLYETLGVPRERIDVVYPLVATAGAAERRPAAEPTFLCLGALDPHKQPGLAVRAFAEFRRRVGSGTLRFVGPADPSEIARYAAIASQLGIQRYVRFEGPIGQAELESAFTEATALVSSSRIEGFGLPPVEAILRGVPVVAVDTAVAREVLAGAAEIVPGDIDAIASAMERVRPPTLSAINTLRERVAPTAVARALETIYRSILD